MTKFAVLPFLLFGAQVAVTGQSAWTESILHSFSLSDGGNPQGLAAAGGVLYGEGSGGGQTGLGVLFSLSPPTQSGGTWNFKELYNFSGSADGAYPTGGLLAGAQGIFYGVTAPAGSSEGLVFSFKAVPTPQLTALHSFSGADGGQPVGPLISDTAGNLYAVTTGGGPSLEGVVCELSPPQQGSSSWSLTILYSFSGGGDGGQPEAGLIMDGHGALYGTTAYGGAAPFVPSGVVFRLVPPVVSGGSWAYSVLHTFQRSIDGAVPIARLTMDRVGNLYGTTQTGGAKGFGTAFRLTPPVSGTGPWNETVLHSFAGSDGARPMGPLSWGQNGVLYGSTAYNGKISPDCGVIYSLTPSTGPGPWQEAIIYAFEAVSASDGCAPMSNLLVSPSGTLYGSTSVGGTGAFGTVFALTPPK